MEPNYAKKIKELEGQVAELMAFMEEKKKAQITYPLDYASQQVLQNGLPIVTGSAVVVPIPTGTGFIPMRINNKPVRIMYF